MISATAHLVDDLGHLDAPDVHTHLAAAHAVGIATNIAAVTAAHDRQTVVRRVREATVSLTVQVEEARRDQQRVRTT